MTVDLAELRPEAIEAADARALELLAEGQADEAVSLLRGIVHRAVTKHGDEDVLTGMAQSRLAEMLRRIGAPEAEQLAALTDAIKAYSASVGPSDPRTTAAFGHLATSRSPPRRSRSPSPRGCRRSAACRPAARARRRRPAGSTPRSRWPRRRAARPPRRGPPSARTG